MTDAAETTSAPIHNSTFSVFIFSILGWALFVAWGVKVNAGFRAQVFPALAGAVLTTLALRRYRLHWPSSKLKANSPGQQRQRPSISVADALSLALMVIIGYVIAQLVLIGSALLMIVFAFAASLVPWSRIPLCRNRFFVAGATVFAATALPLLMTHARIAPFHFLFAAWALAASACVALLSGCRFGSGKPR